MKFKYLILLFLILALIFLSLDLFFKKNYFKPKKNINQKITQEQKINKRDYQILFNNLKIPWSILFFDKEKILITERNGNVKLFSLKNKQLVSEFKIFDVKQIGEGGLLGAALHPQFKNLIYFYYTTNKNGNLVNRVERYKLIEKDKKYQLLKDKIILDNIPAASIHNGGRIKFGPDSYLYITTGDAGNSENSQNLNSLAGKILRIKDDGSFVDDNPFGNEVYAYGIRNSQGITWDSQARLWAIDHGRSGLKTGFDEINLIEKSKNYGWPIIEGDEFKEGMEKPIIHSGSDITWAPADLIYYQNNLFFTGLRGQGLYRYNLKNKNLKVYFFQEFGRLRALTLGPDNFLYFSTSNQDGRGYPKEDDDKILRIDINKLLND